MKVAHIEALICAVLRGDNPSWPDAEDAALAEAFLQRCDYHGVQVLLHERLCAAEGWPPAVLWTLRQRSVGQAMWELRHQQVLAEVLAELAGVNMQL